MHLGWYFVSVLGMLSSSASCGKNDPSPPAGSQATTTITSSSEATTSRSGAGAPSPALSPSPSPQLPPPSLPPFSNGVIINITVEGADIGQPVITGETNLPDGAGLMYSLTDDVWRACDPEKPCLDGVTRGGSGVVERGRFRSITFGSPPLKPGRWEAEVLVPLPHTHPPEVRAVIGEKGERLRGKLVERTKDGPIVVAKKLFQVPAR